MLSLDQQTSGNDFYLISVEARLGGGSYDLAREDFKRVLPDTPDNTGALKGLPRLALIRRSDTTN